MKKTLYISDLDGTLLNGSAELSEYTKATLNAMIAQGLNFSAATARTLPSASKILSGLTLRVPVVLMNGVLIYDMERQEYTRVSVFAPETVETVVGVLRRFETTGFMYELDHGALTVYHESLGRKPLRDFVEERKARYYKSFRYIDSFADVSPEHIIYFTLLDTRERLQPVRGALAARPGLNLAMYKDVYQDLWYLEISGAEASKQNAVNYLRHAYGFERVVGFGDNLNDLPMFAACDVRVATANAQPEVRAAADYICGANDADGVARWLYSIRGDETKRED
jgi:Cof subfamily protein (haloacid dehalogenase superfamily)